MSDNRGYDLAPTLDIDTPERAKAIGHPLRQRITDLVLERAMSVTELANRTDRPKGTVAYHVDVLTDAGLLKVVATRKVRALTERSYGRTARTYMLPSTPGTIPFLDDVLADFDRDRGANRPDDEGAGVSTYRRARIPLARAREYVSRLMALTEEFVDEPRDGDTEYGMYVLVFPTMNSAPDRSTR